MVLWDRILLREDVDVEGFSATNLSPEYYFFDDGPFLRLVCLSPNSPFVYFLLYLDPMLNPMLWKTSSCGQNAFCTPKTRGLECQCDFLLRLFGSDRHLIYHSE